MTNMEIHKLYGGTVKIKYYPDSHRYQLEGHKDYLIGVTSATGIMDKSAALLIWAGRLTRDFILEQIKKGVPVDETLIEEAINQHKVRKEEAATTGSLVHAWAEDYIKGKNPVVPEDEQVRNGVLGFLKWISQNDIKFLFSEKVVYSKKHEYVGMMDTGFTMGIENHKIKHPGDFKTSSGIYGEMVLQVSAYQEAEAEENGTEWGDKYLLRFDKLSGEFETHHFPLAEHQEHLKGFLASLNLKRFQKEWDKTHYYAKK